MLFRSFSKHFYYRHNIRQQEYFANFWVFNIDTVEDLNFSDTTVYTKIYKNIITSHILGGRQAVTWYDLLVRIKQCSIGTYSDDIKTNPLFFIKYRYDDKYSKAQFYFGSLGDYSKKILEDTYEDFTNHEICYDREKNQNLNCCYFEVIKNEFITCFHGILE